MGLWWDHMETFWTLLQTDNHTNTQSLIFTGQMLFLTPNQQRQSTCESPVFISQLSLCFITFYDLLLHSGADLVVHC